MVRKPGLELLRHLRSTDFARPAVRYLLYGEKGTGKTLSLCHSLHFCATQGWLTLHVPDGERGPPLWGGGQSPVATAGTPTALTAGGVGRSPRVTDEQVARGSERSGKPPGAAGRWGCGGWARRPPP